MWLIRYSWLRLITNLPILIFLSEIQRVPPVYREQSVPNDTRKSTVQVYRIFYLRMTTAGICYICEQKHSHFKLHNTPAKMTLRGRMPSYFLVTINNNSGLDGQCHPKI